jgi:hypothetical protein
MKTYKVQWFQHGSPVKINADTSHDAYRHFLEQEEETKALAVLVKWGAFGIESFSEHLEEGRKAQEALQKAQKEERKKESIQRKKESIRERELERARGGEALRSRCLKLAEKLKTGGFKGTNHEDRQVFIKTINRVTFGNKDVTEEEVILADVCLTNPACFNFLMLRNLFVTRKDQKNLLQSLAYTNETLLSKISSQAGGIKAGTTFAGLAAAKHLGEEMAEDF